MTHTATDHPEEACASARPHAPHSFRWERRLSVLGPVTMTYQCPGVTGDPSAYDAARAQRRQAARSHA